MQRANRPPDLDLSTTQSLLHNSIIEKFRIPKHASTPEKILTNQMQDVSLSIRPVGEQNIFTCGFGFTLIRYVFIDHSSTENTVNNLESEWESDDSFSDMIPPISSSRKIPHQSEKEIRLVVKLNL